MKVVVDDKSYIIKKPGRKEIERAKAEQNRTFKKYLESGDYFLREELYDILRKRGFWNDEKQKELEKLKEEIAKREKVFEEGGVELEEAKQKAFETRLLRMQLLTLTIKEREYDDHTVDAKADNAYFDALVAECVYDEEGNKIFSSYQDYEDNKDEEYASTCARALGNMLFDVDSFEKELPENKFLLEYEFVDEDLNIIDNEKEPQEEEEVEFKPFLKNGEPVQK